MAQPPTTAPGVWLKAPAPPEALEPWLGPGWSLAGGRGTRALVRTVDGAFAARGQVAITGRPFVVDQVETDPAHQRRGPGRLVMHALVGIAAGPGAAAGVLVATPEGRALRETVGWRVPAPLTGAMRS